MIPTLKHKQKCQKIIKKQEFWKKFRDLETASDQISLIIFHLGCADQVILLSSPVPKTTKKVIGEETVNRIPDDVYVDRLFYPKSEKEREIEHWIIHQCLATFLSWINQIHSDK